MLNRAVSEDEILISLAEQGVKQITIANHLGLPPSAVSNLYKGKRQLKLSEANKLLPLLKNGRNGRDIPLIGMAGAGQWVEAIERTDSYVFLPGREERGKFAVTVAGDSMNQLLPEGSTAVIDTDDTTLFSGKIYLLLNSDGEATIKRFRMDPARFEPVSDNPEYVPFELGTLDFTVIGQVTSALIKF